jgi:hypothetical protein
MHLPSQLQTHPLAFHRAPGECSSLFAEVLNGFPRVLGLGSINSDQTHTLTVVHCDILTTLSAYLQAGPEFSCDEIVIVPRL